MSQLHINNVSKHYGSHKALHDINIQIESGEFLVLIGPSGCGKSTLLNSIAGLDSISDGDICIGDRVVTHVSPKDRDIAMVFQSYALYPSMNVYKNIAFGLEMKKVPKEQIDNEVKRVATMLQIDHLLERKPAELSGGQRQRVAMGRALAREPAIYLFDEPLSNLDAKLRVQMRTEIKKLHQRLNATIVYVTHDQIEAMTLADRIAVMRDGHLQQLGTPADIYEDPCNMFVAGFMGSPAINFVPARVHQADNQAWGLELTDSAGETYFVELPNPPASIADWKERELIVGIRPEHISHNENVSTGGRWTMRNLIEVTEPTGPDTLVFTRLNNQEVTGRVGSEYPVHAGEYLTLSLDLSKAVFFDPETEERIR